MNVHLDIFREEDKENSQNKAQRQRYGDGHQRSQILTQKDVIAGHRI